jgi:hypothetical protein
MLHSLSMFSMLHCVMRMGHDAEHTQERRWATHWSSIVVHWELSDEGVRYPPIGTGLVVMNTHKTTVFVTTGFP